MTFYGTLGLSFEMAPIGLEPHTPGPNCWNGASVSLGLANTYRFMHPDEYLYLLKSYCEETDSPITGSMARMFDEREVHAYIWISESSLYAKHSNQAFEPYEIMDYDRVRKHYFVKRECALQDKKPMGCFRKTKFYNCSPHHNHTYDQILKLNDIENLVFDLVFSSETKLSFGANCNSSAFIKRNEILIELKSLVDQLLEHEVSDPEYLKTWILSIKEQIYMSEVNSRSFRCRELSYEDKYVNYINLKQSLDKLLEQINLN